MGNFMEGRKSVIKDLKAFCEKEIERRKALPADASEYRRAADSGVVKGLWMLLSKLNGYIERQAKREQNKTIDRYAAMMKAGAWKISDEPVYIDPKTITTMHPLTIAQAIEKLKTYPQDWLFLTSGYEDGYDAPLFEEKEVRPDPGHHEWDGEYTDHPGGDKAIIVKRTSF